MKLKNKLGILIACALVIAFGFYQYKLSQDRNHIFSYSSELHLYQKRSFTAEDKYEVVPVGQNVQILRLRKEQGSVEAYIEVVGKKGWVSNQQSSFEIRNRE